MKEFKSARVLGSRVGGEPDSEDELDWGEVGTGIGAEVDNGKDKADKGANDE